MREVPRLQAALAVGKASTGCSKFDTGPPNRSAWGDYAPTQGIFFPNWRVFLFASNRAGVFACEEIVPRAPRGFFATCEDLRMPLVFSA